MLLVKVLEERVPETEERGRNETIVLEKEGRRNEFLKNSKERNSNELFILMIFGLKSDENSTGVFETTFFEKNTIMICFSKGAKFEYFL